MSDYKGDTFGIKLVLRRKWIIQLVRSDSCYLVLGWESIICEEEPYHSSISLTFNGLTISPRYPLAPGSPSPEG